MPNNVFALANSTLMITRPASYFGTTDGPVAVHDAASPTLALLCVSDGPVHHDAQGRQVVSVEGLIFEVRPVPGSAWALLHCVDPRV